MHVPFAAAVDYLVDFHLFTRRHTVPIGLQQGIAIRRLGSVPATFAHIENGRRLSRRIRDAAISYGDSGIGEGAGSCFIPKTALAPEPYVLPGGSPNCSHVKPGNAFAQFIKSAASV
jgi:hypothetical protein